MGRKNARSGFTLVELLVVIGIIALLISILLPSLNKARESSRRVKCLSNMRQIVMGMQMFAQDNQGFMPGNGNRTKYISTKSGSSAWGTATTIGELSDWICWRRAIDPVSGQSANTAGPAADGTRVVGDGNITFGGLAKYLGSKQTLHSTPEQANSISPQLESVYRCPSDKIEARPQATLAATQNVYRYSYAANALFMNPITAPKGMPTGFTLSRNGNRNDGDFNGKIASIRNTSNKIMLICEDEQTIQAAFFHPQPYSWTATTSPDLLASRHDGSLTKTVTNAAAITNNDIRDCRGNVVMADGHGEFMYRRESLRQIHTGNPYPDPTTAGW